MKNYLENVMYEFDVANGTVSRNAGETTGLLIKNNSVSYLTSKTYRESIPQLQLSMTDACNMSCSYCSFRSRIGVDGKPVNMDLHVATDAIKLFADEFYKKGNHKYARIDYGLAGEPMLRRHLHSSLYDIIVNEFSKTDTKIVWAGPNVTNATLALDEEVLETLGPPQDISCDGPKEVHDDMRKYNNGKGTYDDVRKVMEKVLEKHPGFGVSAVLTAKHPNFDEIFLHHYELGFRSIYMKPVNLGPDVDYGLNTKTLPIFIEGYTRLFNLIMSQSDEKKLDYLLALNPEDYFMRFFYRIKDRKKLVYRCGAGKSGVYADTNGKLYACAHFIGKTGWDIGDVKNGFNESKRSQFLNLHVDDREPCKSCWARYLCGGGCYYQAALSNGDISKPDEVKCDLIRFLAEQAIRMVGTLAAESPEVLFALPSPILVSDEYLAADKDTIYRPVAQIFSGSSEAINLVTLDKIKSTLMSKVEPLDIGLQKENTNLHIKLKKNTNQIKSLGFWFIDLKNELIAIDDVPFLNFHNYGHYYRFEKEFGLSKYNRQLNSVRRVPYEPDVYSEVGQDIFELDRYDFQIELDKVFENYHDLSEIGFNVFIELENGGNISLISHEPFCIIPLQSNGNLSFVNVEIIREKSQHFIAARGMVPYDNLTEIKPNVC